MAATTEKEDEPMATDSGCYGLLDREVHLDLMYRHYLSMDAHVQNMNVETLREVYRVAKEYPHSKESVYMPRVGMTIGQILFFKLVHMNDQRAKRQKSIAESKKNPKDATK